MTDNKRKMDGASMPVHLKYPKYDTAAAYRSVNTRMKPSELIEELVVGGKSAAKHAPPRIIEFLNLEDNTSQVNSIVDVDEPLFQPYPMNLSFEDYQPFETVERLLFMRNNDNLARRIKIIPPDSEYFAVSPPMSAKKNEPLKNGKVAAGMEVCFKITFKPQEKRDYSLDLVCCSEREKFVVPIKAVGTYAVLNFPDEVDFGLCPVKKVSSKTMVVRNIGTKASKFLIKAEAPFTVETPDVYVDVDASVQVRVSFLPEEASEYDGDLTVTDEDGHECVVLVSGLADNVNVYLGQPTVEPDPAYISLSSQKTVKIYNRSEYPVAFQWKAFATVSEEREERGRLADELARMEVLERENLEEQEFDAGSDDDDLSDDEGIPYAKRQEAATLTRKYKNLRKAVQEDSMVFADENFQIEPTSGEIWANSEIEITVTFRPQTAAEYDCAAFLDVIGRDSRLPLQLSGKGIGPKATLSYDVLDIGDVFVNSVHRYEITMQNRGDIESRYELQPSMTPFGPKFQFSPATGVLAVGESHTLEVTFCSEILGEFSEHFNFKLWGSDEPLAVHFKGHVVGPTFHFDVEEIDFSQVSYDFLNSKTICLMNTSEIPMKFVLRVPQDGNFLNKEFQLIPPHGTVLPAGKQQITVDFISTNVKRYDYYLTVDVEGVGEGLLSIPIMAECQVPLVRLLKDELNYGECFMRFPYQQTLTLVNESDLKAKYEVVAQDEHSQAVASYEADAFKGAIQPYSQHEVSMTLVCEKLGNIRLPLQIRIAGSSEPPLMATVNSVGIGPNVKMNKEKILFGDSPCLIDHHQMLELHNDSLIPAPFKAFIKSSRSKFSVSPKEGVLAPQEKLQLRISAHLDDTVVHNDMLHVIVTEGQNLAVPLSARGTKTTMYCDDDLTQVDFGYQLTNKVCEWRTTLENKGRRTQVLTWVNKTLLERFSAAKRREKEDEANAKKKRRKAPARPPIEPVFTVIPETIELRPRTACTFTFRGFWKMQALGMTETLVCETKVGQEKNARVAFTTKVKADFIVPLLEPSMPKINFNYTYSPDVALTPQSQPLTLKNVAELPLTFMLRTASPFKLDLSECSLAPQECVTLEVGFEPGYKNDRQTHEVAGRVTVVYRDHPQKDSIELLGEVNFPNLDFEYTRIDFGSILNDTTKSMVVKVKNCSKVNTGFQWAFCEDEDDCRRSATVKRPYIPVNQIFDILPIRSYLAPDETEEVEFIYYGHAQRKFKGVVLCEVEGGPEYELTLLGEASSVSHKLDKQYIDFGQQLYSKQEEREFIIINTGKVSFPFNIRTDRISRLGVIEVHPMSGRVFANDKQRIVVKFRPGIPERLIEEITVECGHFAPVDFPIYGQGIYASVAVTLPRMELPLIDDTDRSKVPEGMDMGALPPHCNPNVSFLELLENARFLREQPVPFAMPGEAEFTLDEQSGRPMSRVNTGSSQQTNNGNAPMPGSALGISPTTLSSVPEGQLTSFSKGPPTALSITQGGDRDTPGVPPTPMGSVQGSVTNNKGRLSTAGTRPPSPTTTMITGMTGYHQLSPLQMALETEADRLYYQRYLLFGEEKMKLMPPPTPGKKAAKPPTPPGGKKQPEGERATTADGRKIMLKPMPEFLLSMRLCDFGNVVSGSTKQKKFKITNTGHLPVSFAIDKKLASAYGFTIEPERVVRLPEGESVDFIVIFAASPQMPLGTVKVDLPLEMRNGPPVVLTMLSNITVPDVEVTTPEGGDALTVDCGRILVGQSKIVYAQLHNKSPVVADWSFKKPMGSARDLNYFTMKPDAGSLAPGDRVNVAVEFTPKEGRHHQVRVPIKVQNNNERGKFINFKGEGAELSLKFDPPIAEMGPVLPYDEDKQPRLVTMTNTSDVPIEVYSLDFDQQFIAEEEILADSEGYGIDDGVLPLLDESMRLPVRHAGTGLPDAIMKQHNERVSQAEEKAVLATKIAEAQEAGNEEEVQALLEEQQQAEAREGMPPPPEPVPTMREKGEAIDTVLFGPAQSGVSTQARLIASKNNCLVFTVEEAVEDIKNDLTSTGPDSVGTAVRTILKCLTPEEQIAADEIAKSTPRGKKGDPVAEEVTQLDAELLARVLRVRLKKPDAGNGAVLDGLTCSVAVSVEACAVAAAAAMGSNQTYTRQCLILTPSTEAYVRQLQKVTDEAEEFLLDNTPEEPKEITEGEENGDSAEGDAQIEEVSFVNVKPLPFVEKSEEELEALGEEELEDYNTAKQTDVRRATACTMWADRKERATAELASLTELGLYKPPVEAGEGDTQEVVEEAGDDAPVEEEEAEPFEELDEEALAALSEEELAAYNEKKAIAFPEPVRTQFMIDSEAVKLAFDPAPVEEMPFEELDDEALEALSEEELAAYNEKKAAAEEAAAVALLEEQQQADALEEQGEDEEIVALNDGEDAGDMKDEEEIAAAEEGEEEEAAFKCFVEIPISLGDDSGTVYQAMVLLRAKDPLDLYDGSLPIPDSSVWFLQRKPVPRANRAPVTRFKIVKRKSDAEQQAEAAAAGEDEDAEADGTPRRASVSKGKKGKKGDPEPEEEVEVDTGPVQLRWVLQPNESCAFDVEFGSAAVGRFDSALGFEIVGSSREFSLSTSGLCSVPNINSDPRNVFMSRIKGRPERVLVAKKYVMNRGMYEFGPLLINKSTDLALTSEQYAEATEGKSEDEIVEMKLPSDQEREEAAQSNSETFRISNAGKTPAHVDFSFERQYDPEPEGDGGKKGKAPAGGDDSKPCFIVQPACMDLAEGETQLVRVWALPTEDRLYTDALVCSVGDNPHPVCFPLSCVGAKPTLEVTGPWGVAAEKARAEVDALEALSEEELAAYNEKNPSGKAQAVELADKCDANAASKTIDFDRLLLKRSEDNEITFTNTSTIPVAWKLDLAALVNETGEELAEFEVTPQNGRLMPGQETKVTVSFAAIEPQEFEKSVVIVYSDVEGGLERMNIHDGSLSKVEVKVVAEAYDIKVCSFEEEDESNDGMVDFGTVRVGEKKAQSFNIKNNGKYDIKYQFNIRRASTSDLFTIEPMEAVVAPGESFPVTVTFQSSREITLKDNKDIRCVIMEATTGDQYDFFSVTSNVRSVFSRFKIQPQRGINFGALKYNEEAKTRSFELRNEGEFPYAFSIVDGKLEEFVPDIDNGEEQEMGAGQVGRLTMTCADADGVGELELPSVDGAAAVIGQFTCNPGSAVIEPGQSATVEVSFAPAGAELYRETLRIDLTGRDYQDAAASAKLNYEAVGESCFPGINTGGLEDIFEEQQVIPHLEVGEEQTGALFLSDDNKFSYGSIVPSSNPNGMPEKFKISNPDKVPCTVNFAIEPEEGTDAGVFTVQPAQWVIPSHEHRYVTAYFKPSAMRTYGAQFVATVEDASDDASAAATNKLQFELSGAGTMPNISIVDPLDIDDKGCRLMKFGRLQVGKSKTMSLTIDNPGTVLATVLFEMEENANSKYFTFSGRSGSVEIQPGESKTLDVGFHPTVHHDEMATCNLKVSVLHNEFEACVVQFMGTGYVEDLTFEDLPNEKEDELVFEDMNMDADGDESKVVPFTLKSHSNSVMRFQWAAHENITFSPSVGFILPKTTKQVLATFSSKGGVELNQEAINMTVAKINTVKEETDAETGEAKNVPCSPVDWDDTMKTVRGLGKEEYAELCEAAKEAGEPKPSKKVTEIKEEPASEPVEGTSERERALKTSAVADTVRYELDSATGKTVAFKQTFMFQTRVYKFSLKNASKSKMDYHWNFEAFGGMDSRPSTAKSAAPVPCPYTIEPSEGSISRESSTEFTLRFTPLEVDDFKYQLSCAMPGLPKKKMGYEGDGDGEGDGGEVQEPLTMLLAGRAARPVCHFDLDPSDYLQRRPANMLNPNGDLGSLPQNVHVVEMSSLGTRVRNTKRFYVINPQNVSYEFTWEPEGAPNPAFRCVSNEGLMLSGKRSEMVFEYTPDTVAMTEAFYRFRIPAHGVNELFLFNGTVLEPKVSIDRSKVDFTALLLGGKTTEVVHLVNHEHIPFSFNFERASFDFPGGAAQRPQVELDPVSGVVPPNGRCAVEIKFAPSEEKSHNFNLICNVKRKPTKLALNVKGEGYAIHDLVEIEEENPDTGGTEMAVLNSSNKGGDVNYVDFGMLHVNEKVTKRIFISNSGKFNYDFNWNVGSSGKKNRMLTVKPEAGTVPKGDKVLCEMTFHPEDVMSLDAMPISCLVAGSRNYELLVSAKATQPALLFSFMEHDFGPCFIAAPGAPPQVQEAILRVTNQEVENDVSFDCLIDKTSSLEVKCQPTVLAPDHTVEIPILFTARENKQYELSVPFLINGTSKVGVKVMGEGVSAKVELVSPGMQNVSFSTLQIGQDATKTVRLVNRSKCPVTFSLVDEVVAGRGRLEECGVSYFPQGETTLRPKETCNVEVAFSPLMRTANFAEELMIEVAGSKKRLLTVSGACTGMEVSLETDTLPFGSVCENSQLTRHLNMENTGDVVTKFQWDDKGFGPDFSITPVEGFLAPFSSIKFEVCFKPKHINDDIRYDGLMCYLQGADPLSLTLTGKCIPQPDSQVNAIAFNARARQEETKPVEISNPSDKPWTLIPALESSTGQAGGGDLHWRLGSETVSVPAKGKASLDLVYAPHSMTKTASGDGDDDSAQLSSGYVVPEEHNGRLFIALPDGNALLYNLTGQASEPDVAGHITEESPAKKSLSIKLPVENWMKDTQRFTATIEVTGPDFLSAIDQEASTFITGAEMLVVPAQHTRDYNLKFYAYNEGETTMKVTFKNQLTGEFIFYHCTVTVVAPESPKEVYKLEAPVRQTATKNLTLQNPFGVDAAVTFPEDGTPDALEGGGGWWQCTNKDVQVVRLGEMQGSTECTFEIRYRPLVPYATKPGEETELLIKITELGTYRYRLALRSTAAGTERSLNCKAPLGSSQQATFRFRSFLTEACEFTCSTGLPQFFEVQDKLSVQAAEGWDGQEVSVTVTFEPEALGEVMDTLTITSEKGGEYSCALHGQCTPALPKGPFTISKGGQADMSFKNVFDAQTEFIFSCDHPAFTANNTSANIAPKAAQSIAVKFAGTESGKPETAKLLVTCPSKPNMPPWVYYLKGEN